MDERREIFRVYIELCKRGSQPISDQNSQMLYYNIIYHAASIVWLHVSNLESVFINRMAI